MHRRVANQLQQALLDVWGDSLRHAELLADVREVDGLKLGTRITRTLGPCNLALAFVDREKQFAGWNFSVCVLRHRLSGIAFA